MNDASATLYEIDAAAWEGAGTEESPFLVRSRDDRNAISRVLKYTTAEEPFRDVFFKQTASFDIFEGIGIAETSSENPFCGTYDGDSYRLNCNLNQPLAGVAPFHRVVGATIKNLQVTGYISGGIHSAGLVAFCSGNSRTTIDNCRVSADIAFTGNDTNNAYGGGIIGHASESEYNVTNCLFDGSLNATSNDKGDMHLGAIVGWGGSSTHRLIDNCIEMGSYNGADKSCIAFSWKNDDAYRPTNYGGNYYFSDLGHSDGADQLLPVESGTEGVTLDFYNHNWQTAYHDAIFKSDRCGFLIGGQYYIVKGQPLSFRLDCPSGWNVTDVFVGGTKLNGYEGVYTIGQVNDPVIVTIATDEPDIILYDAADNQTVLAAGNGQRVNVTLSGRTLYKDDSWNTICLPFDLSLKGSPLEGAVLKTLDASYFDASTSTLTLYFSDDLSAIEAGKPYIIKWEDGDNIVSPVFTRVTIEETPSVSPSSGSGEGASFIGTFSPATLTGGNKSVLYMGSDNNLYYPAANRTMNAFRAYF